MITADEPRPVKGVVRPMRFAVIRRWNDNPADFQVLEYMATRKEAVEYIVAHPHHSTDSKLVIARWV